ncbi:hypothetical protein C3747_366g85c [Trypanosoma cruzi]|uniref:ER protein Pkr1 n=2 Tax=Trypanosoma cruzi TaxID=5693 RepID=Q4DAI5_TRYCC|nr:hypothetical protein, conserved [Trypanosoma cruzi]EAN89528.1 hypothetical protein, conserved [Trypanosoma cruzi]PWU90514.1 hypothetical protein C3747_366g85c [Trypanosoma cruzi]|eukprot:XP_811379.1 hypothetical protein [Trypanosoma cruzi strain CL Brener]
MSEVRELPWLARLANHILTPGSALSPAVWITFNVVMAALFFCWLSLVFTMPDNIHIWTFGFLGAGLAFSTNWLFKEIFNRESANEKRQEESVSNTVELHEKKKD